MNPSEWIEPYKSESGSEYHIPDYKITRLIDFEDECEAMKHELEGYKLLCARLVAVTRFYGMRENWTFSYGLDRKTNYREITAWDTYFISSAYNKQGERYGGKTARIALGEFKGQIAKLEEEIGTIAPAMPVIQEEE
jgi:hypothetical protein